MTLRSGIRNNPDTSRVVFQKFFYRNNRDDLRLHAVPAKGFHNGIPQNAPVCAADNDFAPVTVIVGPYPKPVQPCVGHFDNRVATLIKRLQNGCVMVTAVAANYTLNVYDT
ncbi:hypothetical protein [Roseinatronobacter sp.]|uniref:hypothetical protein n=1 Tax=Roseinatronobacter sp. TaxID=1945755 RepID=UPI003F6E9525